MTEREELLKTGLDLLYLAGCSIRQEQPEQARVAAMELPRVHELAKKHMLTAVCYMALEKCPALSGELRTLWKEETGMAIRNGLALNDRGSRIRAFLDQQGIWHMPLKGTVLQALYPRVGMRQMSDQDILFDPVYRQTVRDYMAAQGYQVERYGKENHDVYFRPPNLHFELHTALFDEAEYPELAAYYSDVRRWLVPEGNSATALRFEPADLYVYLIAHDFKHFQTSGTGVRSLLDLHLVLRRYHPEDETVRTELERLGLCEYERASRCLAQKTLASEQEELTAAEQAHLLALLDAGVYGSTRLFYQKKLEKTRGGTSFGGKLRYFIRRLVPDDRFYRDKAPFFYQHRALRPVYVIWRFFRGFWRRGGQYLNELRTVWKYKGK